MITQVIPFSWFMLSKHSLLAGSRAPLEWYSHFSAATMESAGNHICVLGAGRTLSFFFFTLSIDSFFSYQMIKPNCLINLFTAYKECTVIRRDTPCKRFNVVQYCIRCESYDWERENWKESMKIIHLPKICHSNLILCMRCVWMTGTLPLLQSKFNDSEIVWASRKDRNNRIFPILTVNGRIERDTNSHPGD